MRRNLVYILLSGLAISAAAAEKAELVLARKIWDSAPHNAFTDLIRYEGKWLCAFREGKAHVSDDGTIRITSSRDGTDWDSWDEIKMGGVDLRDPKICITPGGELMLTTAGADRKAERQNPVPHQSYSWLRGKNNEWRGPFEIGDPNMWLWRVTWHKGTAYSIGYDTAGEKFVRLYRSSNGRQFDVLVPRLFGEGSPNESGLVFQSDDTAICLLRRDGEQSSGMVGRSRPPYTDWSWKDLGVKIGGPQLIELPGGRLIAGVRLYDGKVRTAIVQIDAEAGKLTEMLALPSGGDTSYPGLVWHEGILWVSYYSSHEGKTAIYLAKVKL